MRKIICLVAGAAALLVSAPPSALAAPHTAAARTVDTHRCTPLGDYCIVLQYNTSSWRVPLIIAHKVSGKRGRIYWARWTYKKSGHVTKASRWKRSSWTGENGQAPGVAVETLWGHRGQSGGPKLPNGTVVCTQFKGSNQNACYHLG